VEAEVEDVVSAESSALKLLRSASSWESRLSSLDDEELLELALVGGGPNGGGGGAEADWVALDDALLNAFKSLKNVLRSVVSWVSSELALSDDALVDDDDDDDDDEEAPIA